jgi:hypothetical protein
VAQMGWRNGLIAPGFDAREEAEAEKNSSRKVGTRRQDALPALGSPSPTPHLEGGKNKLKTD